MARSFSSCPRRFLFGPQDEAEQTRLEAAADRLLGAQPQASWPDPYPYHSENWLRRLAARDAGQAAVETESLPPVLDRAGACLRMLGRLALSRRQRLALRLLARGHVRPEIAALLGVDRRTVSDWLRHAARLIRKAAAEGEDPLTPPEMIREIYRHEVERHGPAPERHCRPGHEECRRTGICTRRWYLHYSEQ